MRLFTPLRLLALTFALFAALPAAAEQPSGTESPAAAEQPSGTESPAAAEQPSGTESPATAEQPDGAVPPAAPPRVAIDSTHLGELFQQIGFSPRPSFKALVVAIRLSEDRTQIAEERWFDWAGTSQQSNWNPASTVKIIAALGAIWRTSAQQIAPEHTLCFQDHPHRADCQRLDAIMRLALVESDNVAYNRLVQIAGYDRLNQRLLQQTLGLRRTILSRPYARVAWQKLTGLRHFHETPVIHIKRGLRALQSLAAEAGHEDPEACEGLAACTTLADLAEVMRRVMLSEQLPPEEQLALDPAQLRLFRSALRQRKERGNEAVDALHGQLRGRATLYHKPGFAARWMSDVIYLLPQGSAMRYIVVLTSHPGRVAVVPGAAAIGKLIARGAFQIAPSTPEVAPSPPQPLGH